MNDEMNDFCSILFFAFFASFAVNFKTSLILAAKDAKSAKQGTNFNNRRKTREPQKGFLKPSPVF
jgi:hypothetical protein